MSSGKLDVKLNDQILNPYISRSREYINETGYYKSTASGGHKKCYKVWLYIEGKDTPFVKSVKYVLHKSFISPIKIVPRTVKNPNCALVLWTWGKFVVKAEVEDFKGRTQWLEHHMTFGEQIQNSKINWIRKDV